VSWVKELRQQGKQVTMYMLQLKAKDLAKRKEWIDKYPDIGSFLFIHKWIDGLMIRNNWSNRRRITIDHLNTSPNQTAEVEDQTLREFQEMFRLLITITIDEQIGDNYYDENELNYVNLWDN
jgi:hypothetical protein